MPVSAEELFPQVQAAAQVLEKVSAKEREQYPHKAFADNYNNLLALAKEAMPETDPRRWPPVVEIHIPSMGFSTAKARYVEFHSYLKQIEAILAAGIEPAWGGVG